MALVGAQFVNAVSPNPVGSLQAYAGASAPSGWLLCDGGQTLITAYPELYSVLGTTYGTLTNGSGGAGSTHFRVPDLRGRVPLGAGTGAQNGGTGSGVISGGTSLTARTIGQFGGDERLQAHAHTVTTGLTQVPGGGAVANASNGATGAALAAVSDTQGGGSGQNMPPFLVTNYIIKAVPDAPRSGLAYGSTPPIVTALPSNPQFGDVVTYIADATNGVAWNLQYDASGTYPWKFIGGAPWMEYAAGGNVAGATPSYTLLTGYTVALPGDYMVTVEVGFATATTAAATFLESGPVLNSEAFSYPNVSSTRSSGTATSDGAPLVKTRRITAPSVGGVLRGIFQPNPAGGSFNRITETVTPIRVKAA